MLEQDISDIRENLRRGRYPNEAAVSQGIVRRLLATLGWPVYDPQVVYPEYTLEGRRVDLALCHPAGKPRIFIEVKGVGKSDKAKHQLFEYAFHQGVPLAVLTDGREWSFFLPAGAGSYDERRIYKLNLAEHDVATSVRRLERYLRYEAVCSEEAFVAAQEDYRDIAREREIHEALPKAWAKLVAEENEYLIDAVAECVEGLCGYQPESNTVTCFLRTLQPHLAPLPSDGSERSRAAERADLQATPEGLASFDAHDPSREDNGRCFHWSRLHSFRRVCRLPERERNPSQRFRSPSRIRLDIP